MTLYPIFIAGCDRSGTTMLGDLLGAAPNAFATPESQWVHEFLMLLHIRAFQDRAEAANWLRQHFRFAVWNWDETERPLDSMIALEDPRGSVQRLIRAYLQQHCPERAEAQVWVDHTPDNFKHYAVLKRYFPEAGFIHIVRDGRAVYQSIKPLNWGPNNAYMATRYWTERLQQALGVELAEGDKCRRVRYEDLLDQPYATLQSLCDWAGLDFVPRMIDGGGVILPGFTRQQHQLVGQRPDPARSSLWRQRLSDREIAEFEAYPWSRTLLQTLGYPLDTPQPHKLSTATVLLRYAHDFVLYFVHRRRHRKMEARTVAQTAAACAAAGD